MATKSTAPKAPTKAPVPHNAPSKKNLECHLAAVAGTTRQKANNLL